MQEVTIKELKDNAEELTRIFAADSLDYSLGSFAILDSIIDEFSATKKAITKEEFDRRANNLIIHIGCYVGETFKRIAPEGKWEIANSDPTKIFEVAFEFPGGGIVWPMQKAAKRLLNGEEDSLHGYAHFIALQLNSSGAGVNITVDTPKKKWWKFW